MGLSVRETPATVEVVNQPTMQEQGYRTSAEIAKGAVGVLDIDSSGAPADFSMRGFTFGQVNVLYNGISIGAIKRHDARDGHGQSRPGRVPQRPVGADVGNECDRRLGQLRQQAADHGANPATSLTCRWIRSARSARITARAAAPACRGSIIGFDAVGSSINSFIDGDWRDLTDLATQFNYHVNNKFMTFVAIDYKKDSGHAYWGTPLVPTSFAGGNAVNGVVSGNAISTFSGDNLGPMTIDRRTLTTNYNVADNATGAQELWLRSGFEWTPLNNVTVKDQVYYYQAKRNWLDSETYAFDDGAEFAAGTIDRDRFFVTHNQHVIGNNIDFLWDSRLFGMDNRLAAQAPGERKLDHIRGGGRSERLPLRQRRRRQSGPGRLRPGVSGCPEQTAQ